MRLTLREVSPWTRPDRAHPGRVLSARPRHLPRITHARYAIANFSLQMHSRDRLIPISRELCPR
nr:MAG TPA: hypothetical protein [Caudoviricetes sp.]